MPQSPTPTNAAVDADGVRLPLLVGADGALATANVNAVQVATEAGAAFFGTTLAAAAGVTTSVALATTYTGLCLSNPAASGVNLVVDRITAGIMVVTSAATLVGLIQGYAAGGVTVHTTPGTIVNSLGSSAETPLGKLDLAATIVGTPAWREFLAETAIAAGAVSAVRDYDGGLIIPPGGYVAIGTNIASPANGLAASIQWREVTI